MLDKADLQRLDYGASRSMRRYGVAAIGLAGVVLIAGGMMHVALAAKYAAAADMRLGEVLTLWGSHAPLDQSFSGAAFNAVQNVSAAIFEILYGIALFLFAFIIHRRAQFYARVRAALPSDSV